LKRKLDALLKHHGIELPSGISPDVQLLARDPTQKIFAIKLHREDHPGLGLAEAKAEIEAFTKSAK
jgi:ribosomal protein L7/L12